MRGLYSIGSFGEVVRMARRHLGLSLRTVAARVGVSHGHLSRVERGARASLIIALRLADVLELDRDALRLLWSRDCDDQADDGSENLNE